MTNMHINNSMIRVTMVLIMTHRLVLILVAIGLVIPEVEAQAMQGID